MEPKVLAESLTRHAECSQDGQSYHVPDNLDLTLFVSAGHESLVLDKVRDVLFEDSVLVASSRRGERFVVRCEDVRCLRITGGAKKPTGY